MDLFTLMGKISVESTDALNAISNVKEKAQELYNYINNHKGTIHVNDGTATSTINKVMREIEKLRRKIDREKGTIKVENTTALSVIGGVSTAVSNMYALINTNTGVINVDTSTASGKIEQLKIAAQEVAGYLGGGTGGTSGTSGTGGVAGAIGTFDGTTPDWESIAAKLAAASKKGLKIAETATGVAAAAGLYKTFSEAKDFFQTGFEYNQNMEKWTASLKTYLGNDLEEATKLVADLQRFAIDTPLSMEEVMNQAVQLLATGTAPDKLIETLSVIGDISKGDMETFSSISRAYWQIMTTGRLLSQDANQLTQAGVPIWQIMTDYFNHIGRDGDTEWTVSKARELATAAALQNNPELAISGNEVFEAFKWVTSEGNMYYNAMNNLMDTEYGKAQKMQDNYAIAAGTFMSSFFDVFTNDTIPALNGILDKLNTWASQNPESLEKLASAFSTLATKGIGGLLGALQQLIEWYGKYSSQLNLLAALVGTLLMFNGAPKTGLALITMATAGTMANAETEWGKDISGENDGGLAELLLSEEALAILQAGGSREDLPEDQQKRYDMGEAYYGTYDRFNGLYKWLHGPNADITEDFNNRGGLRLLDLVPFIVTQLSESDVGVNDFFENGTDAIKKAWQSMFGGDGGDGTSLGDKILNLLFPSAGAEEAYDEGQGEGDGSGWNPGLRNFYNDPRYNLDGVGGANGTNTLQGILASLPAQIEAAAKAGAAAGCAEGVGNITVTGTVTTGNVTLDTGAIVGQIAPRMNLVLGGLNAISGRG